MSSQPDLSFLAKKRKPLSASKHAGHLASAGRLRQLKQRLPWAAGLLLLAVVLWPQITRLASYQALPQSLAAIKKSLNLENRLYNPFMQSTDPTGRPYTLKGESAFNTSSEVTDIRQPETDLEMEDNSNLHVTSDKGTLENTQNTFDYQDNVRMQSTSGYDLTTRTARVYFNDKRMDGNEPVTGQSPQGHISAQGFAFEENGNKIVFKGPSQLTVK